ncbi:MAG: ATP-binding protein [Steroidobacteraceae bacterium]
MDEFNEITRHLLRFSPDALIVVDDQRQICYANDTVTELFGYSPTALLGRPVEVLIPERWHSPHIEYTAGFMQDPSNREMGARKKDLFARRADGSEFSAGIRLSPFKLDGKVFVVAAIRDTTERRQINEELIAAREKAEVADRAKGRFLAIASHDLRQPLHTIRLLNAGMLKLSAEPQGRDLLQRQEQAIEVMSDMLNALLDISRLESGSVQPKCADVSLSAIFDELRVEFDPVARVRNLIFHVAAANVVLHTDSMLFHQLLENLVGNAFKYTHHGSVSVKCVDDGNVLTVTIKDTGVGIPADKLARVFDDYYQVDEGSSSRVGVGLGLAIVKEVARLLNFTLRIVSVVGEGTEVHIAIPRGCWECVMDESTELVLIPERQTSAKKPRIFLVEDNEGVRIATELFFKLEGFEVRCAGTYVEAEKLVDSMQSGDVLIADYHLDEDSTGLDLLMHTRQRLGYALSGIILSGDLSGLLRRLQAPILNTRFLSKPVDTKALIAAVGELTLAGQE